MANFTHRLGWATVPRCFHEEDEVTREMDGFGGKETASTWVVLVQSVEGFRRTKDLPEAEGILPVDSLPT